MSYTNEDIFCAVRDGDLEKVRRMVKDGVELSQVPEREVIRSSRGYVFEIDPAERTETNHLRQGFNFETHSTARTEMVFTESLLDCAVQAGSTSLVEYLLEWKECQRARMAKYGVVQGDHTPVLANDLGDRMSGYVLGRWWRRNRAALGCPGVHYHDLRHTFATNLAKHNVHPKAIQSLLRHKDDRTAMRIYTHVNVEQMMSAVMSLEDD